MSTAPVHLLTHLMHAFVQGVANEAGIDVLHVKGPALHPELLQPGAHGPLPRRSTDADVLVRPGDAQRLLDRLLASGCQQQATFTTGSPFEHAANVWSDHLGHADIHRFFPGIQVSPDEAFAALWSGREYVEIAHQPCATPSLQDQRLILLLHAARSGGAKHPDKLRAWDDADPDVQADLLARAHQLRATVGLAAALGTLDEFRDDPSYQLWDQFSRNPSHSRTQEWIARFKAARSPRQRLSLLVRAMRVNTDRLAMDLGREPTPAEVRDAARQRYRRAFREARDHFRRTS